jgi:hypothetical protein
LVVNQQPATSTTNQLPTTPQRAQNAPAEGGVEFDDLVDFTADDEHGLTAPLMGFDDERTDDDGGRP